MAPTGHLRRKDSQWRQAGRAAGPAADDIRARHQSQHRQGARSHHAALDPRPRRRGHRMNRLAAISFLISVALTAVAPALAQSSGKIWRLGVLTLPTSTSSPVFENFRSVVFPELAKQGYVEGGNLVVEIRVGAPDKLPELARELGGYRPRGGCAPHSVG